MQQTVLYFGSFNPIHKGHTSIAQYVVDNGYGEVWLVVSPQNPLKNSDVLVSEEDRLEMVDIALNNLNNPLVKSCDVEFTLSKPSYTINTLNALGERHPNRKFSLLVGSDIVNQLDQWKDYRTILENYTVLVYPRHGIIVDKFTSVVKFLTGAPLFPYSSSQVRERISRAEDYGNIIDPDVMSYIKQNGLWKLQ